MPVNWKEYIAPTAAILAILGTVCGAGFTVGTYMANGKKEILEENNKNLGQKVQTLDAEVKDFREREAALLGEMSRCQAGPVRPTAMPAPPEPAVNDTLRKITVVRGDTGEVKNELSIAVPAITVAYKPFRYIVSTRVTAPGNQESQAKDLSIGERLRFKSYEIQLLSADLNKARFALQKL